MPRPSPGPESSKPVRRTRTIVVIGAGIAGLCSALALARSGFRVIVAERNAGPRNEGAGIQLSPNAMHVLKALGVDRPLLEAAFAPEAITIRNGLDQAVLSTFALGDAIRDRHGAPYIVVHRADLQHVLLKYCEADPDIDVRFSTGTVDMVQHRNGITALTMGGGEATEIPAGGIIGADGVWSQMRNHIDHPARPRDSGLTAWRALINADHLPPGIDRRNTGLWLGPNAHLVHYPLRSGEIMNVVAVTPSTSGNQSGWRKPGSPDEVSAAFSGWADQALALLESAASWGGWPLFEVPAGGPWINGKLALAGDAAHAMLPFAAQGGAVAIEDAATLARFARKHEDDLAAAWLAYQKDRRKRVAGIAKLAQNNRRVYHLTGFVADMRNKVMPRLPQQRLQRRMDWVYGWRPH